MLSDHLKKIFLIIFLIILISLTRPCNSHIFGKPLWPCPYNSRLKHLYIKDADGPYTSQSLFDIYSFTHISHGMILFFIISFMNKVFNLKMNEINFTYLIIILEIFWEIIENTPYIINKYRKNSIISRDYKGDSVINSLGDVTSTIIGFLIALYFTKLSVLLLILNEIVLYYFIKDNLFTNVMQVFT